MLETKPVPLLVELTVCCLRQVLAKGSPAGSREMVKCLLCNHEDLSVEPQKPHEKLGTNESSYKLDMEGREQEALTQGSS